MTTAIRAPFMDVQHSQTNNNNTVYQQSPGKRKRGPDLDSSTNTTIATTTKPTARIINSGLYRRPSDAGESVEANSPSARVEGKFRKLRLQSPIEGMNVRDGGMVIQSGGTGEGADVGEEGSERERCSRHKGDEDGHENVSVRSEMILSSKRTKATIAPSSYESSDVGSVPVPTSMTKTTTLTTTKPSPHQVPAFTFESNKLNFSSSTATPGTTQPPPAPSPSRPFQNPHSSSTSTSLSNSLTSLPSPSPYSSSPNPNVNSNPNSSSQFWQPSEITGWTPDDPDEDNYGVNGVGYHKTPALAYSLSQRRKRQIAEYRSRESQEARRRRGERRLNGNGNVGSGSDGRSGKEDEGDSGIKDKCKGKSMRLVRFESE